MAAAMRGRPARATCRIRHRRSCIGHASERQCPFARVARRLRGASEFDLRLVGAAERREQRAAYAR
ncbi:hypothetical protein WI93_26200 [Burkholderia vietnamiensis]|nr:hypothetical protein WI93_26200 [Burkholderia vietnamiensis]